MNLNFSRRDIFYQKLNLIIIITFICDDSTFNDTLLSINICSVGRTMFQQFAKVPTFLIQQTQKKLYGVGTDYSLYDNHCPFFWLFSVDRQNSVLIERIFLFPGVKNATDGGTLCLFLKGNLMSKPHCIFASFPIQNS